MVGRGASDIECSTKILIEFQVFRIFKLSNPTSNKGYIVYFLLSFFKNISLFPIAQMFHVILVSYGEIGDKYE